MTPATQCLQTSDIEAMLAGTVSASQNELWEEHLSTCESCRRVMASQIGDQQWWQEAEQSLQHVGESLRDLQDPCVGESLRDSQDPKELVSRNAQQNEHRLGETELRESDQRENIEDLIKLLGPTDDPQMLGRIGSYEVLGVLGRGGMGVVFKAFDAPLNRFVAIKMLLPHLAASGAARKRFAREGQAVAAVVDDHVMAIHCVDQWKGLPYLVMTYSRGVSLQKRLSDNGPLEVREILRIGMQAAKGLAAAHAQGIVHRDIKPANIFLDQNVERVQLMDFGLARAVDDASLTRSGVLAGTPQYMSPEQARAETIDHRSDLFSLGSVMYAMCTGHAPFRAESSYSVLRLITDKEPRTIREINPDIPVWLCEIISKLMAKRANDRFASAKEVAELLEACLAHVQQPTSVPLLAGFEAPACVITVTSSPKAGRQRMPPIAKMIAGAILAMLFLFFGVVIMLETNKGTLTIESETDGVPIVDAPKAKYDVSDNQVVVSRGSSQVARITFRPTDASSVTAVGPQQSLNVATREFNNLHPSDSKGRQQPQLLQSEILAVLKWKMGNDELSDEIVGALQPILFTREGMLPTGWRLVGGQIDQRCPQGIVHTWQIKLETNGISKPITIRKSAIALRDVQTATLLTVALKSLVDQFNSTNSEIQLRTAYPHELPPLTLDELLAADIWSQIEDLDSAVGNATEKRIPRIGAMRELPPGTRIELVPSVENSIGQRFYVERIQLVIPDANDPAVTDTLTIRNRFVAQDWNDPAAIHWSGPGANGLQVGVRLSPAQHNYQHGQVVDIDFLYRSVTNRKITATLPKTFQFGKVRGVRLERVSFVQPRWPDGSTTTLIGNEPMAVKGHRMQICFNNDEELKPGVNLRAMTRPQAHHYITFTLPNPGDDSKGEMLEIRERPDFSIPPLTPRAVLPLFESHYYRHWGTSVPKHRWPEESTPAPEFIDPFQLGVSLGLVENKQRIPAYYASGFKITKIAPYSPAEAAGIQVGDILLSWEGNQFYGDDPAKPFANNSWLNNQLREQLEQNAKSRGRNTFNMDFDLLDHHSGEVIHISPWFGQAANGGPNKAEILKRMEQRRQLRQKSEQ